MPKGIVHRDIKSANIIVEEPKAGSEPQAKIMDFGLAQLGQDTTRLAPQTAR